MGKTFETSARPLEQFLFIHDIFFREWKKSVDGMTVWVYDVTPELERVVKEYRDIVARRSARKGGADGNRYPIQR